MATGLDVVKASLRAIRVIDADETPSASDAATTLFALNSLLGRFSAQPDLIYQVTEISHTLTPGDGEYTVGSAGNIAYDITRIQEAYIRQNGTDLPLEIYTEQQYQDIPDKTDGGTPLIINLVRQSKVRLWPIPVAADTLRIMALVPFSAVALATTLVYPAEYQDFITLALAKRVAPEFGRGLWNAELQDEFERAERVVTAMNISQTLSPAEFDLPQNRKNDLYYWIRGLQS